MDKVRRILVYVCKDGAAPQRAQFIQSVVGQLSGGGSSDQVEVSCWLEENRFLLSSGRPEDRIPLKLLDAGLRELEEETGLRLDPEGLDPQILGLWESVFPPLLSRGPPQRHHIVVYMLLKTPQTHQQLQASLSPAPSEVSACLWADGVLAKAAVDGELRDQQPISVTQVSLDGSLTQTSVPAGVFSSVPAAGGPDLERLSTGTKFALELWLRTLKGPD
ncbi:nucleoside diphosphate-linked moiety X motif 17-like isoform 1-T5 [Menidia menidia]